MFDDCSITKIPEDCHFYLKKNYDHFQEHQLSFPARAIQSPPSPEDLEMMKNLRLAHFLVLQFSHRETHTLSIINYKNFARVVGRNNDRPTNKNQ